MASPEYRIWVPGAGGMLGQAVMHTLLAYGYRPHGTGRELDIGDAAAVAAYAAARRPTHVINCAAYTQVDACETDAAAADRVNGAGPGHLGQIAAALGARVAHISTDYVFAGTASQPYVETAPCAPVGAYGRSKWAGEQALWAALGPTAAELGYVVRTSWLFGKGGGNFVQTMLRLFGTRPELAVVADQFGRPTYCDDLAEAVVHLLGLVKVGHAAATPGGRAADLDAGQQRFAPAGTYHFANAGPTSWHGFATGILQAAQAQQRPLTCTRIRAIATADYPTPAQRPAYSVLSTDKIARVLGQTPRPWQLALGDYLAHCWDGPKPIKDAR
jgi:dTDP-4-dehydrorhamnose reductase